MEVNPDLIDAIANKKYNEAETTIHDILAAKMQTALDQEKIGLAQHIFNTAPEEEQLEMDFEEDEEDIEEEDIEEDETDEENNE